MTIAIATSSWRSVTSPAAATRSGPWPVRRVGAPAEVGQVVGEVGDDLEQQRDGEAAERGVEPERRPRASAAPRPTTTPASAAGSVAGRAARTQMRSGGGRRAARPGRAGAGAERRHQGRRGYLR